MLLFTKNFIGPGSGRRRKLSVFGWGVLEEGVLLVLDEAGGGAGHGNIGLSQYSARIEEMKIDVVRWVDLLAVFVVVHLRILKVYIVKLIS